MQTQLPTHPTQSQLADFAAGKLARTQADAVAKHLDACSACSKAILALPADSMTGRIQAAQPRYQPVPTESWAGDSPSLAAGVPLPDDFEIEVPRELAQHPKYRIVGVLGRGGMGVVYKAEHQTLDRTVAVKVISKALLVNADAVQRFLGEARAAAKLNHPSIVQVFDADQAGDLHFLVMEFVEGKSLAEILEKRQKPLPIQHACAYIRQAALGLQQAHERNMVHRDIKPQNLMLTPKGQIKILDFGLARLVRERATSSGLTAADSFLGTPEYVAPEQAADARSADIRADLYSLGCTLYFLLTGRPPFREATAMKVVLAHVQNTPPSLLDLRSDTPPELSAIVQKLLAKSPAERFQTPGELAQALTPLARGGSAAPPPGGMAKPEAVSSPIRATAVGMDTSEVSKPQPAAAMKKRNQADVFQIQAAPRDRTRTSAAQDDTVNWKLVAAIAAAILLVAGAVASIIHLKTRDGVIEIIGLPEDAVVEIDGARQSITIKNAEPIVITQKPGTHKLRIERAGFQIDTQEVELSAGGKAFITARFIPKIDAPQGPQWISLLNGKDLTGWATNPGQSVRWFVQDGILHTNSFGGLYTERSDYRNFRLRAEFRADENCHAQLLVRSTMAPSGDNGYQIQLNTEKTATNTCRFLVLSRINAKAREVFAGNIEAIRKDQWFTLEIEANENRFVLSINGSKILEFTDEESTFAQGHISLQRTYVVKDVLQCRKFEIQEIDRSVPKGANLEPVNQETMVTTDSGLKYVDQKVGNDEAAMRGDTVSVHYTGWLKDGTKFDSSRDRNQPFQFQIGGGKVIKGWEEGAQGIRVGGKRKLIIPAHLGYGPRGAGVVIPPNAELIFEIELLKIASKERLLDNAGFVELFNGKDLAGWKTFPGQPNDWRVENGMLIGSGPMSHLFTERGDYENLHFRVEAMINSTGNSGQYFRADYGPGFLKGYEAQINALGKDPIRTGSLYPTGSLAKYRDRLVVSGEAIHKPDEWFTQEVIANGNHILIKVNGKTTVGFIDPEHSYKRGYLALQQHDPSTVVKFRKVEVKELPGVHD